MMENELVAVNESMPSNERRFPGKIEFLASLRLSNRYYRNDGGRIMISADAPELDSCVTNPGDMYSMSVQIGILGHAAVVNKELCVCESMYATLSAYEMMNVTSIQPLTSTRWLSGDNPSIVRPTPVMSEMMMRSAVCYSERSPLFVYSNVAVLEASNHSSDSSFWMQLYKPMETVTCQYGWKGIIFNSTTLSMGSSCGDDDNANLDMRKPSNEHDYFIDPCYTPKNKSAGRIRSLAIGVRHRIETARTYELVDRILVAMKPSMTFASGDWVLRWKGFVCKVTYESVLSMLSVWKDMCEDNMPVMHVFKSAKVVVISSMTGMLIRPMKVTPAKDRFEFQGPYVDSMVVNHCDTLKILGLSIPSAIDEPEQYSSILLLVEPFHKWSTEPRENLNIQMALQGLGLDQVKGDATIMSLGETKPMIVTSYMDVIMNNSSDEHPIRTPGKNAVVAFINRERNTEDAVSIMKEWAESGAFAWHGFISYPLPSSSGVIRPGTMLKDQSWWVPAIEGLVTSVTTSKSGQQIAIVYMVSKSLVVGDKLMMGHGVKFTVGELIPFKDMPVVIDEVSGEEVKPNVLVNTKNLTRGIGGLIREMSASTSRYGSVRSFRGLTKPTGKYVYSVEDEKMVEPKIPTGFVSMYGTRLSFKDSDGSTRMVKCSYGLARLTQIRHMAVFKQHYPSKSVTSIKAARGKMHNGTPRLGEMELMSMMMQGLVNNVSDAVTSTDSANMTRCTSCFSLPFFCDCPIPKPPLTTFQVRYSLTEMCVFATIAMLNTPDKPVYTLRFMTST